MIELKFSTKKGKKVYSMGTHCQVTTLNDIYKSYSERKKNAYYYCLAMYDATQNRNGFGIGNANSYGFTVKWFGEENGETFMRVETKDNSYKIWLNR